MTWLPAGYLSRPVDPEADLETVLSLLRARDLFEVGRDESTPGWLVETWANPKFDLTGTLLVSTLRGDPAAYAEVSRIDSPEIASTFVRVHPSHAGKGLGGAVLGWTERRAAELPGVERIHHTLGEGDAAGRSLLEARGYSHVRTFWHMERGLETSIPSPSHAVEPMAPGEERQVHRVISESFEGHFGLTVVPFEAWWAGWRANPSFDPSLWLVTRAGSSVVGAVLNVVEGDVGWVGELGVLRPHRKQGMGTSLLNASFALFVRRGCRWARLNVDSDNASGASRLYGSVGMRVHRGWVVYERSFHAGAA